MKRQNVFVKPLKSDYWAGYEAGLRRAQELAKEHATLETDTRGIGISWRAADAAIDAALEAARKDEPK